MERLRLVVFGLGNRARKYLSYLDMHPKEAVLAAVIEPDKFNRAWARRRYGVPGAACFADAESFFSSGIEVDAAIVASPDRVHYSQMKGLLAMKCPALLEKPAACSWEECQELERLAAGIPVGICYVMRFHPYYRRIKDIIDSEELGRVVSVEHTEFIGPDRMGHTYVRGHWSKAEESAPIFLSKCCHDVDMLLWLLGGKASEISSEGSLSFFCPSNAPAGSMARCIDCPMEQVCRYSAVDLYRRRREWTGSFVIPDGQTLSDVVERELTEGRFGRCVFHCDNDVFDRQTVSFRLGDIPVVMKMDGITPREGRVSIFRCEKGTIEARETEILILGANGRREDFTEASRLPLHAYADHAVVEDFFRAIREGGRPSAPLDEALESHRVCFVAQECNKSDRQ